ncbi:hypothetical protein BS78_05G238400 [Paspalum vaginatum]|nr:hypothetical protein BS78_05G238400 [Paspalum vaginatum]
MGIMDQQHLGSANHLSDIWNSPRGTVLRIEALTLVAIALSFFIAAFGSCRRWSNHWIIQKGFAAANGLFLSLGTYSIGLMQSSSVKSKMYPIWAVSLLGFLCCIDPSTRPGPDNNIELWKMLYLLCLYNGYVMLMSISTISSDIYNVAICVLSAFTFMKGFHRSMALVLPGSMRNMVRGIPEERAQFYFRYNDVAKLIVDMPLDVVGNHSTVYMSDISTRRGEDDNQTSKLNACKDVCFSFSLSHLLQRRFHLLQRRFRGILEEDVLPMEIGPPLVENFIGICFVGTVAVIPGTRTNRHASPGTIIVDDTVVDIIITEVILVCLALLQVFQLLCCWTSNWARVAFACDCIRNPRVKGIRWRMRQLRASLIKVNLFGSYLWQNKIGQHSIVESASMGCCMQCCVRFLNTVMGFSCLRELKALLKAYIIAPICSLCSRMLGLQYIGRVLQGMLWGRKIAGDAVELHADVKASIADFIGSLNGTEIRGWASFLAVDDDADDLCTIILRWHVATCYCELAQERDDKDFLKCTVSERAAAEKHHRVAIALSKYCAYLVVSAPWLLCVFATVYDEVRQEVLTALRGKDDRLEAMELFTHVHGSRNTIFGSGVKLGMQQRRQPAHVRWKKLADLWVMVLVYAAPSSNNVEEHLEHLSQGGEFITHLWALLYHAGVDGWSYNPSEAFNEEPTQVIHLIQTVTPGEWPDSDSDAWLGGGAASRQPLLSPILSS